MSPLPAAGASSLDFRKGLLAGDFSAVDGIRGYLDRLEAIDGDLCALTETFKDRALEQARECDRRLGASQTPRPLEGIPFTAKSNIATVEGTTDASSAILSGYRAPEDATAVSRLRAAGAILVGKTRCDEFAMGSSTETSVHGPTANPWDHQRVPGGSSGGAAALAGAHGWGFHLGSDTGGSIRQPAALCGATGHKPTYGRVSRWGLVAFGSSLDQIGPLCRDADDAAAILAAMEGGDPLDSTSWDPPSTREKKARVIGVPRECFPEALTPEVEARVREAIEKLGEIGCEIRDVSLPNTAVANACYYVIATAEASSNLARYDGIHVGCREAQEPLQKVYEESRATGFGAEVRRRILLGTFVLSAGYQDAYYRRALAVRDRIGEDFDRAFEEVDLLAYPVTPDTAFGLGERITDPLALYACDILTVSVNLAGVPAVSVPCGFDSQGLPVGLQLVGPRGEDRQLLALASEFQQSTEHHRAIGWQGGDDA